MTPGNFSFGRGGKKDPLPEAGPEKLGDQGLCLGQSGRDPTKYI